ncbi:hypothetical protein [Agrobacterium larrymoorei]|uniref:Uncharacterized protein n=1 Tax=Agrobacterium larrymoorei TaxID=160699 RepID=A0A4D7DUF2_9HYPH|nr:hypothetical protein [Agrobacterium larrymoorei]QCI99217.1 hypothetical protein CFBP5473_14365 [Agrobacterium larrymoorei]QYA08750.1 hypothetical protein J5285_15100 [Agrobacterium larrymoorei]QYA08753.1 hypothetical protein J5285_15115 [Agrobacterium larrymoorei]
MSSGKDKHRSIFDHREANKFPLPWKVGAFFWLVIVALMLAGFAAQEMGWHGLSSRLFGYSALCAVGYVISWLCSVFVSVNSIAKRTKYTATRLSYIAKRLNGRNEKD